jgi:phosphotriesterase-related protein
VPTLRSLDDPAREAVCIAGTGIRAGLLKVVTDAPGRTEDIARVMSAAAVVHAETGVPITTHSNPHLRNGLDQARFLLERGARPDHLVIGHSGDSDDLDYLLALLDLGVTLGFARFGMAHTGSDEQRAAMVLELLERGHARQLLLSHDSAYFSRVTPPSWRRSSIRRRSGFTASSTSTPSPSSADCR